MADASDSQLQRYIDRMNGGDPSARDALINHSCDRLLRLTRKMLKDFPRVRKIEESGDVLQKAAMRLQKALKAVQIGSVDEFFRLAALQIRRELLSTVRRLKTWPHAAARADEKMTPDSTALPANELSDSTFDPVRLAFWRAFHEQVELLPDKERETFSLIWYLELTHAEAAAVLKVTVSAIKKRMWRAKDQLQDFLK